jgi:ABC-2 type transport system ATP-binding protein
MIQALDLRKSYGPRVALDGVTFEVQQGEILGFLGPNGAGKTTTMRILTGFLPASGGEARVAGFDVLEEPDEVKRRVGYLPETPPLYPELTVGGYLGFIAELRGYSGLDKARRAGRAMERVGLVGWEDRILGSLSKGYRQRVGIAQAILHEPPVLILDEPTSGLDPGQVAGIRDLVRSFAGEHTVILSTHILSEVEAMCPRAVVIAGGRVRADGTLETLRASAAGGAWTYAEVRGIEPKSLASAEGVTEVEPLPDGGDGWTRVRVRARNHGDPREALAARIAAAGGAIRALERRLPTLEETFLDLVGREGRA